VNLTHRSFQADREAVIHRAVAADVVRLVHRDHTQGQPGRPRPGTRSSRHRDDHGRVASAPRPRLDTEHS
jgi:hypothetical protein